MNLDKTDLTKQELKEIVGDALRSYATARADDDKLAPTKVEPGRRCWTLLYDGRFHVDVLPAIPNPTGSPSWRVKTVLQRTVQVLKLHRNGFFANDPDNRPPSCVISTLAGRAYTGEASLGDALVAAASDMPRYLDMNGTEWVLENPAQPGDNLADRWTQSADARDRFLPWLADLRNTLVTAQQTRSGMQSVVDTLSTRFDRSLMEKSVTAYAERQRGRRQLGALTVTGAGTLATGGRTTVRDHTFHGE